MTERNTEKCCWMLLRRTSELVAYHRRKRVFLSLANMEQEDPDQIQICEFKGQDFELIAD